ncbi:MAG: hypothetical protein AAFZ65_09975 [Planctomycetota bacterium]
MRLQSTVLASLVLTPLATSQHTLLIAEGDPLPGNTEVNGVLDLTVAGGGHWAVQVGVRAEGGGPFLGTGLIVDGEALIRQGEPIPSLTGAAAPFDGSVEIDINAEGQLAWIPAGSVGAILLDLTPVAEVGQPVLAAGAPSGSVYTGFNDVVLLDSGELWIRAAVSDPQFPGFSGPAVLRLAPDGAGGFTTTVERIFGQQLSGLPDPISKLPLQDHAIHVSEGGRLGLLVNQQSVSLGAAYIDGTLLALESQPAPLAGAEWLGFEEQDVAVNDAGDAAFVGSLLSDAGASEALVVNGAILARTGETLPAIAPFELERLNLAIGGSPLAIDDQGNPVWWGQWNSPDEATDEGIFRGDELVFASGVSTVDGLLVEEVRRNAGNRVVFQLAEGGTQLGLAVELEGALSAAVRIDLAGSALPVDGCTPNAGLLSLEPLALGDASTATMDAAQTLGAVSFLALSTAVADPGSACGTPLPGAGELLISLAPGQLLSVPQTSAPWNGTATAIATLEVPTNPALLGLQLRAQGVWIDPASAEPLRLTNGVDLAIGG